MGKINGCLKCLFIFFNVLFALIGCLLILGMMKASIFSHQLSAVGCPSLGWGWLFSIGVLGISCLGIFAACSEKEIALKIFAGFMAAGMIIMLIFGIVYAVKRNQIKNAFESASSEYTKAFMEDENIRMFLEGFQTSAQCCGVVKAEDWGQEIPDSCACKSAGSTCKARPRGTTGPDKIHAKSCSWFIFVFLDIFFKIAMGFFFAFSITALLGLLVSLFMIHQVRRPDSTGESSMAMKSY